MVQEIFQKHYPTLEIDNCEKDVIQIYCEAETISGESQLILIERKNIQAVIDALEKVKNEIIFE